MKTLDSLGFRPISDAEFNERTRSEVIQLGKQTHALAPPSRWSKGRPRKEATVNETLKYEALSSDDEHEEERLNGSSKRPAKYTCWFAPDLWAKIEAGLKLHAYKFQTVVTYL